MKPEADLLCGLNSKLIPMLGRFLELVEKQVSKRYTIHSIQLESLVVVMFILFCDQYFYFLFAFTANNYVISPI